VSGDNLDVTSSRQQLGDAVDVANPLSESNDETNTVPVGMDSDVYQGLSWGQKLFFLGVIVGICALFLRSCTNKGSRGYKQKSMA